MNLIAKIVTMVWFKVEDALVARILQMPQFHHGVRKIHRTVEEFRHGRDPNEPLREGEATEDPNLQKPQVQTFVRYFVDEMRNQARGTPTDIDNQPLPPKK
ncbi:hypothetical protein B0H65DRAFT_547932 [Neurospora tetraspora]|uniref:Uncharacterized protein n=1 Tax=Neurospora tetraspora TaxID=94610 RepID=A0AAE0JHT8_9PEZI|nr:hypothetical protein B0H65DRAFT_547932 [Neurospora tetraspora]